MWKDHFLEGCTYLDMDYATVGWLLWCPVRLEGVGPHGMKRMPADGWNYCPWDDDCPMDRGEREVFFFGKIMWLNYNAGGRGNWFLYFLLAEFKTTFSAC